MEKKTKQKINLFIATLGTLSIISLFGWINETTCDVIALTGIPHNVSVGTVGIDGFLYGGLPLITLTGQNQIWRCLPRYQWLLKPIDDN